MAAQPNSTHTNIVATATRSHGHTIIVASNQILIIILLWRQRDPIYQLTWNYPTTHSNIEKFISTIEKDEIA